VMPEVAKPGAQGGRPPLRYRANPRIWKLSRWLTWTPGRKTSTNPEPTKPTKPGFVGFDGSPLAGIENPYGPRQASTARLALPELRAGPESAEHACPHCGGSGECECISCGQYKARMEWAPGPCLPCEARKRQQQRVQ